MLLLLLSVALIIAKALTLLTLFQIKEYRFDRMRSMLQEKGFITILYAWEQRIPKKNLRGMLIFGFFLLALFMFILFALEFQIAYYVLQFAFIAAPVIAFLSISIGVALTEPLSRLTRAIMIIRAQKKIASSNAIFIAITGSYGKTSVKEYLTQILSTHYSVASTEKNMNTEIGIAQSILRNLQPSTKIFIVEVGAYRKGEIAHAAWYIPFHAVILTGLGNQHVDLYGSREILIAEECWPLTRPSDKGSVYVSADQTEWMSVRNQIHAKIIRYGGQHADIIASKIHTSSKELHFTASYKRSVLAIKTLLHGAHTVQNLLPVIACAIDLGMEPHKIQEAIAALRPVNGKLSLHTGPSHATIINDTSNSNLHGFLAALRYLSLFPQQNKKYVITQGIIELGKEKGSAYSEIVEELIRLDILLYTTDRDFILNSPQSTHSHIMIFNDVPSMMRDVQEIAQKNTILLLEGKFADPVLGHMIRK